MIKAMWGMMIPIVTFCASAQIGVWTKLADERQMCHVTKPTLIRYGANNSHNYYLADTDVACNNGTFGGDPAGGYGKECDGGDTANPHPYLGWKHESIGSITYSFFKPQNYASGAKFPLVVYVHAVGDRGQASDPSNAHINIAHMDVARLASDSNQQKYPCFIYAPQCPTTDYWVTPNPGPDFQTYRYASTNSPTTAWLDAMREIDTICAKYRVDTDRIYVMGGSMGGYGTWYTLMKYPNRFAAAIPVAGGGDTTQAAPFAHVPVWAFHDAGDPQVLVIGSQSMVRAMQRAGGTPRLTTSMTFTDAQYEHFGGHWYIIPFSVVDSLMPWLFSQKKAASGVVNEGSFSSNSHSAHGILNRAGLQIGAGDHPCLRVCDIRGTEAMLFDLRGEKLRSHTRK